MKESVRHFFLNTKLPRTCRVTGRKITARNFRVECRVGGSDLNPYLAMSALIAAGIDGIENKRVLEDEFQGDAYNSTDAREIPQNLRDATVALDESKMLRAGANRVISPYQIGGRFMASVLTRPGVTDFFQQVTLESGLELWLEEMVIGRDSKLDGQTVFEADIRRTTGVTMVGLLRHSSGETLIPDASISIEVGDVMIVIGTREQLAKLQQLAESPKEEG